MIKSMKPPNSSSGIHHPIARILQLVVLNSLYRKSSEHPPPGGVPSALFVPLANYLPPTFRLPAMAMSQQKAFAAPAQLPILIPHRQPLAFPILQKAEGVGEFMLPRPPPPAGNETTGEVFTATIHQYQNQNLSTTTPISAAAAEQQQFSTQMTTTTTRPIQQSSTTGANRTNDSPLFNSSAATSSSTSSKTTTATPTTLLSEAFVTETIPSPAAADERILPKVIQTVFTSKLGNHQGQQQQKSSSDSDSDGEDAAVTPLKPAGLNIKSTSSDDEMANSSQQEEENHNRRDEIQDLLDEERKRHKTAGMTLKYTSGALLEEKPHTEDGGRIGQFVVDARPFMMPTSSKAAADDNSQHEGEFSSAMKNLLPNSSNQRKATGNRGGTQESYKVKEQADFDKLLRKLASSERLETNPPVPLASHEGDDADILVPPGGGLPKQLLQPQGQTRSSPPATSSTSTAPAIRPSLTTLSPTPSSSFSLLQHLHQGVARLPPEGGGGGGNQQQQQTVLGSSRQTSRVPSRHTPKTNFEFLVEDYKNRLAGQNGIADLMNALRNAHIGFFDSQSQVAVGKMLKRIE